MKLFENLKLKQKIIAYFLAVILFTVAIIAFSVDMFFSRTTTDLADKYTRQGIEQVIVSVESHMENAERLIDLVAKDASILEFLSWNSYNRDQAGHITRSNVRNILTNVVENSDEIAGIVVANTHGFYISNEFYYDSSEPFSEDSWYQSCIDSGELTVMRPEDDRNFKYYYNPKADNIVSIAKPIFLPNSTVPAGAILVDLNIDYMLKILETASWDKTGFVYILGHDGNAIFAPTNRVIPRIKPIWFDENDSVFQKNIDNENYEFVFAKSHITHWTAVGVFSLERTLKPISDFRLFMLFIFIASVIGATLVVTVFSRTIVKPVQTLNTLMREAAVGDLSVRFNAKYTDEIGELGRSFNAMVAETNNLIEIIKDEQRSKRKAELQVLQEQIKPHFLYNTFDTIHWIAKRYGALEIVDIVRALTTILRVGLSRGKDCITVKEELDHAIGYLTIQKIRYGEKLSYKIIAPENCDNFIVQKLILQPIIENALYHGIKNRSEGGRLLLKVEKQAEKLVFSVTDNGGGISESRLEQLKKSFENGNMDHIGFGLFNVNERIRISYGGLEYGVKIFTKPGFYTRIEIHHPILSKDSEIAEND